MYSSVMNQILQETNLQHLYLIQRAAVLLHEGVVSLVKSYSFDQNRILNDVVKLYVPSGRIDCDMTYGRGMFYKDGGILEPLFKFDVDPKAEGVQVCDCRELPLEDESVDSVMFDPPFLSAKSSNKSRIVEYYGKYPTEKLLHRFYVDAMTEAYRVLRKNGVLIFKCQDKASRGGSANQYMSHVYIHNEAVKIGFYPADLFILLNDTRLTADWQAKLQKHSRKHHCYFWVFEKRNWKIAYL